MDDREENPSAAPHSDAEVYPAVAAASDTAHAPMADPPPAADAFPDQDSPQQDLEGEEGGQPPCPTAAAVAAAQEDDDELTALLGPSPTADLLSLAPSVDDGSSIATPGDFNSQTSSFRETLNVVKGPGDLIVVADSEVNLGTKEELELIERVNSGELNIFDAARRNDVATIKQIVESSSDAVNFKDWGNTTALHLAAMYRCFEAVEALLVAGANAKVKDPLNKLALDYIKLPEKKAYLQRVADQYDPDNKFLDDDSTVMGPTNEFRAAAFDGDMRKLDDMLKKDMSLLSSVDKKGTTALMFACMNRKYDCAFYLLERGADIKAKTKYGHTADAYILNPVHRNRVLVFAFKMSSKGRAQSAAQFAKRKVEEKEAIQDSMQNIMEDIREVVLNRESQLVKKARIVSELAEDWAVNYFIAKGEKRAHDDAMYKWQVWQDEMAAESKESELMRIEEKAMIHLTFVWDQVEKRRLEQLEQARLLREADEIAKMERDRIEREKIQREAREEAEQRKAEADLRKAERQALREWEELEQERRKKDWLEHCDNKPHRLKLYQRMRFAATTNSVTTTKGQFGDPECATTPATGIVTSLRQEVRKVVINSGKLVKNHDNIDLTVLSKFEKDVMDGMKRSTTPAADLLPLGYSLLGKKSKGPAFRNAGK